MAWRLTVGIIGAGRIGLALARRLAGSDVAAVVSNRRGPDSLLPVVKQLGGTVTAGSVADAANEEIVVLAVPWTEVPVAVAGIPDWEGRIVIDATNPAGLRDKVDVDLGGRLSSEVVAQLVPGAQLVKAFNTLPAELLAGNPRTTGGRRVIAYSGDHARANAEVGRLIAWLGFAGLDLGKLGEGGRLQHVPGGPLAGLVLIAAD